MCPAEPACGPAHSRTRPCGALECRDARDLCSGSEGLEHSSDGDQAAGKSGKADAGHIPRDRVIIHHIGGQKVRRLRRQSEKTLAVAPLYQPQRESAFKVAA